MNRTTISLSDHMNLQDYLQENLPIYLDTLHRMVDINSFTSNAHGVNHLGSLTADLFARLGFQPEFIQSTNPNFGKHLFLTRKAPQASRTNSPKTIAMVSHLDTVFPPEEEIQNNFFWRQNGDRLYGPGTVDIKGGTVMMYMVLDALQTFAPHIFNSVDWQVALDASEEALSDDFGNLCLQRFPKDTLACLVFEGGTPNNKAFSLVVARKGRATFRVSVEGRSAHAGNNHHLGANAILQLSYTVQHISALTDYNQQITFNVGTINGGSVINRVPHYAEAKVEMRTFSTEIFEQGIRDILAFSGDGQVTSTDGYPCKVNITPLHRTSPWPRNPATEHLFSIWQAAADSQSWLIHPEQRGGLSDGNFIYAQIPVIDGLGPVGNNAHCSESSPDGSKNQEYVLSSSFVPKAILNTTAIIKLVEENNLITNT